MFGNTTRPDDAFKAAFSVSMLFNTPGSSGQTEFVGEWLEDEYRMSYVPAASGSFTLNIWTCRPSGEKVMFLGCPFAVNVHANANDLQARVNHVPSPLSCSVYTRKGDNCPHNTFVQVTSEVVDTSGIMPGKPSARRCMHSLAY